MDNKMEINSQLTALINENYQGVMPKTKKGNQWVPLSYEAFWVLHKRMTDLFGRSMDTTLHGNPRDEYWKWENVWLHTNTNHIRTGYHCVIHIDDAKRIVEASQKAGLTDHIDWK